MEKSTDEIALRFARVFREDRSLVFWAANLYGRPFTVSVGADMRRPPEESDAPFAYVFPDGLREEAGRMAVGHEIGLLVGVSDAGWEEENGVRIQRGPSRLAAFWPTLRDALSLAIPGVALAGADVDYDIVNFPLCMLSVSLHCEQKLPLGRR